MSQVLWQWHIPFGITFGQFMRDSWEGYFIFLYPVTFNFLLLLTSHLQVLVGRITMFILLEIVCLAVASTAAAHSERHERDLWFISKSIFMVQQSLAYDFTNLYPWISKYGKRKRVLTTELVTTTFNHLLNNCLKSKILFFILPSLYKL